MPLQILLHSRSSPSPSPSSLSPSYRKLLTTLHAIRAHSPYSSLHLSNLPPYTSALDLETILDRHVPSYITDGGTAVGVVRDGVTQRVGRGGERGRGGLRM